MVVGQLGRCWVFDWGFCFSVEVGMVCFGHGVEESGAAKGVRQRTLTAKMTKRNIGEQRGGGWGRATTVHSVCGGGEQSAQQSKTGREFDFEIDGVV